MPRDKRASQHQLWYSIMACLIGLGLLFRMVNLDQVVYWVDEVATAMRISGYTYPEVTQSLIAEQMDGSPLNAPDLLQFQQIRPNASWPDFLRVLSQSPEHAPLYFVLMRLWANRFGTSIAAMRSLSVVFSALTLPAIFWACSGLFRTKQVIQDQIPVNWTATGLLAISPYFVAYAQEARPYSLWALLLLLVWGSLGRSLQGGRRLWWVGYTLALTLCLYTSLLTAPMVLGQGLAVLALYPRQRRAYLIATAAALAALLPWVWIVVAHWQVLQSNTVWAQQPMPLWAILGIWHYSFAVLFFDVPVAAGKPVILGAQMAIASGFVALMGYAAYRLVRHARGLGWLLALGSLAAPVALLLLDLVRSGQAAATPRYLMPAQLVILIAVAYCLSDRLLPPDRRWRTVAAVLLSVSVLSCLIGLNHDANYQKSRNRSNPAITAQLNRVQQSQAEEPSLQLIAEADHVQDLISLAYDLDPQIDLYFVPPTASTVNWLTETISGDRPTFLFTPSETLKRAVRQSQVGALRLVYAPVRLVPSELGLELWQLEQKAPPKALKPPVPAAGAGYLDSPWLAHGQGSNPAFAQRLRSPHHDAPAASASRPDETGRRPSVAMLQVRKMLSRF